jgi:hypothetical protein
MQSYPRTTVNPFLNFFSVLESLAISLTGRQALLARFEVFCVKQSLHATCNEIQLVESWISRRMCGREAGAMAGALLWPNA